MVITLVGMVVAFIGMVVAFVGMVVAFGITLGLICLEYAQVVDDMPAILFVQNVVPGRHGCIRLTVADDIEQSAV